MKRITAWFLLLVPCWATAPVITPGTIPDVKVNTTQQFTANQTVTWSLVSGSAGSIDSSTGVYTAPSSVTAHNALLGVPALPNDDILNTRIDNAPVDAALTTYGHAQFPGASVVFEVAFPENLYTNATTTYPMVFNYTPLANANFPILPFADIGAEAGVYTNPRQQDIHILGVNRQSLQFSELYKLYPIGSQGAAPISCVTCSSQSGVKYGNDYTPLVNGVDAAGLPLIPLSLRYQEFRSCTDGGAAIGHALRFTLPGGYLTGSFVWPAVASVANPGMIPYGSRMRLKSSFNISGYSAAAQCVLLALQHYGMLMADGGTAFHIQTMADAGGDFDLYNALAVEIPLSAPLTSDEFEFIDESTLQDTTSTSPGYHTRRVDPGNAYEVPANFVTVKACNMGAECSTMPVHLVPVTAGVDRAVGYSFMAGTPATQLNVWVNGSATTTFSCAMSPSVGTLTSGCLYTPPATSSTRQTTTVTVTPTADSSQTLKFNVYIYPQTGIYERLSNYMADDYGPDGSGHTWYSEAGSFYRLVNPWFANCTWVETFSPDVDLYKHCEYGTLDQKFRFVVPVGNYTVTMWNAIGGGATFPADTWVHGIDYQGTIYSGTSAATVAGSGIAAFFSLTGKQVDVCNITVACAGRTAGSITFTATVVDGNLQIANRNISVYGGGISYNSLNAISIVPLGSVYTGSAFGGSRKTGGPAKR